MKKRLSDLEKVKRAVMHSSSLDVRDGRGVWRPLWSSATAPVVGQSAPLVELLTRASEMVFWVARLS